MNAVELRNRCANEAMKFIHDGSIIGLGGGRNVACLIEQLSVAIKNGLRVKAVTPSYATKLLCVENGIEVLPTYFVDELDVAFDGCGEVDKDFIASKGGGGIHTKEKIIAAMAKDYILLIDEQRFTDRLSFEQTVSLEILKDSLGYVRRKVKELGGTDLIRSSTNKDGFTITDDGNFLVDIKFTDVNDIKKLNQDLNNIEGVIGTSLFVDEVTKIIISGESGIRVVSR